MAVLDKKVPGANKRSRHVHQYCCLVVVIIQWYYIFKRTQIFTSEASNTNNFLGKTSERVPRKVFVDLGANCGNSYLKIRKDSSDILVGDDWEAYLWEANPQLIHFFLNDLAQKNPNITIVGEAATAQDGEIKLHLTRGQENVKDKRKFLDKGVCDPDSIRNPSGGSSIFEESIAVNSQQPVSVPSRDFAKWLQDLKLTQKDRLVIKIDIEGAEIEVLERMLSDEFNDICLAEKLWVEWHAFIFRDKQRVKDANNFKENFQRRVEDKCGRSLDMGEWH